MLTHAPMSTSVIPIHLIVLIDASSLSAGAQPMAVDHVLVLERTLQKSAQLRGTSHDACSWSVYDMYAPSPSMHV